MIPLPPRFTLFPYTTLFRSIGVLEGFGQIRNGFDVDEPVQARNLDRKSTRLNSSHEWSSYAVFCLKKKKVLATDNNTVDMVDASSKYSIIITNTPYHDYMVH